MRFNGIYESSFGHTKAVKFDTSYYTDFTRQEIVSRGLLRSAIEVPTQRNIEVTLVVHDRSKQGLDKKLRDISDWLYKAGVSELYSDRNPNVYYKARCIAIDVPTFAGLHATFRVTFSCIDYRPFDARTNQPIGNATTDLSNFTFNGLHCLNDMHCLFVRDSITVIPAISRNAYSISGRSGTLRYDDSLAPMGEKALSGSLFFVKDDGSTDMMTPEEISERSHAVASWLVNSKRASMILDSDTSRQYECEIIDQSDLVFDKWQNGEMKVKFTLQPYCSDVVQKSTTGTYSLSAATWKDIDLSSIVEVVGYTTPLVITVKNKSSTAINDLRIAYYDENNVEKVMRLYDGQFSLTNGSSVTINSTSYDVAIGSTNALKCVKMGDFPIITPNGNKKIRIYSAQAVSVEVTVQFNVRWV